MYENGIGMEKDPQKAWYHYLLATDNYDRAKLNLGSLYQKGLGNLCAGT
jgi:TPR repeat protein